MTFLLIYLFLVIINFITTATFVKIVGKKRLTMNDLALTFFLSITMIAPIFLVFMIFDLYGEKEIW